MLAFPSFLSFFSSSSSFKRISSSQKQHPSGFVFSFAFSIAFSFLFFFLLFFLAKNTSSSIFPPFLLLCPSSSLSLSLYSTRTLSLSLSLSFSHALSFLLLRVSGNIFSSSSSFCARYIYGSHVTCLARTSFFEIRSLGRLFHAPFACVKRFL